MSTPRYTPEEVARLGKSLYDREIRQQVEHNHHGEVLVIDIETGAYEVAADHLTAARVAKAKNPSAHLFAMRIGFPALARIGGRSMARRR